ncbi:MAG: sulfatase [Planctomycetaceae bacterium]
MSPRIPLLLLQLLACLAAIPIPAAAVLAQPPNILWISCEDISPQLGCYGVPDADTPHLDQLAAEGTVFVHAFSCHGVCAPSRTGIITGLSPISLGANHMRSRVRLPAEVQLFPQLLRQAGYYCTNNNKTDYNLEWNAKQVWDENSARAHWKNRPRPDQPFFAVFNLTMTHESKVWPAGWEGVVKDLPQARRHSPELVTVPPIYPDRPAVRGDLARLADLITVMDAEAGRLLAELSEAGLERNTIVMFWSDHGNGLPRAKRWTYDSGSRVPLIVRVPAALQQQAAALSPGSRDARLISLVDLGPTVLNLAGIPVPASMHGRPFLGPAAHEGHARIYGARDRLDERMDLVRTVRNQRYRYVRNLMPWYPALQPVEYGERNETLKEIRRLEARGELGPEVRQWLKPRAAEELYDLEADPWETNNLIADPQLADMASALREACSAWQRDVRDVHLLPEPLLEEESLDRDRYSLLRGPDGPARLEKLLQAAMGKSDGSVDTTETDPGVLCWQLLRAARLGTPTRHTQDFRKAVQHSSPSVRLFAAAGLARAGLTQEAAAAFRQLLMINRPALRQGVMREIDEAGGAVFTVLAKELPAAAAEDEYFRRLLEHAGTVNPLK